MNKWSSSHLYYFLSSLIIHLLFFITIININSLLILADDNSRVPVLIDFISIKQGSLTPVIHNTKINSQPQKLQETNASNTRTQINELKTELGESEIGSDLDHGQTPRNEKEKYLVLLRDKINKHQAYPRQSKVFKEEGLVKIRMTLDREGQLTKLELIQATKYSRLNDAAMKAASDAVPFSKFPNEVEYQSWKIIVPIRFVL